MGDIEVVAPIGRTHVQLADEAEALRAELVESLAAS